MCGLDNTRIDTHNFQSSLNIFECHADMIQISLHMITQASI